MADPILVSAPWRQFGPSISRCVARRLCVPTTRPVRHGLASEAALQDYRTW